MIKASTLLAAAIVTIPVLAAAIHLYGPRVGRILHGGQ
jgi:hypothetical protein